MPNKRVWFACEQVGFATDGSYTFVAAHGVQSVGLSTSFNLQQVFEFGQAAVYDNIEGLPDIEATLEKVLDGYCPTYLLATRGATSATLPGRLNQKCALGLSIFPDTNDSSSGTPNTQVICSGMLPGSVSYSFGNDGPFTESLTLVGNNKVWRNAAPFNFSGAFTDNADVPVSINGSGGVNVGQHMLFTPTVSTLDANGQVADPDCTILPRDLPGISSSGTNDKVLGRLQAVVTSISVSADFGREDILQLGHKTPFHRYANSQIEVTTDIEVHSLSGDMISATEAGVYGNGSNLQDNSIRVAALEGTRLNMGTKNKLSNVAMNGDTASNQTLTFTYTTYNAMTVTHWNDITTGLKVAQGGSWPN